MKKWIKENKFNITVMLIFIAITFGVTSFHETWRDEAQSWLLARDLNPIELLSALKYEGHFVIWYLILMPFAKLGFPYQFVGFISCTINCIAVWIILKKAPFKNYVKLLFIFSFPMVYLCSAFARCYCLIPLALSLIAWFHKDRHTKPFRYILAIALLANTHVIMLGVVGMTMLDFYIEEFIKRKKNGKEENKKIISSFIILSILLLLSALTVVGTQSSLFGYDLSFIEVILKYIEELNTLIQANISVTYTNQLLLYISLFIMMIMVTAILLQISNIKRYVLQFCACIFYQLTIYVFIWTNDNIKAGTMTLMIMFYVWLMCYTDILVKIKKDKMVWNMLKYSFIAYMVINIISGVQYCYKEINQNYSTAYQVGEYINENLEEGSVFVTAKQSEFVTSIIPYVNNDSKFYYLKSHTYFTYVVWDEWIKEYEDDETLINDLKTIFDECDNVYYIYSEYQYFSDIDDTYMCNKLLEDGVFEFVYESDEVAEASHEQYIIYKVNL